LYEVSIPSLTLIPESGFIIAAARRELREENCDSEIVPG
jgi:hypothetical protein